MEITVKILKELLAAVPDDTLVVLAADAEGNQFAPAVIFAAEVVYLPGATPYEAGDIAMPQQPEYAQLSARPAVALWPGL